MAIEIELHPAQSEILRHLLFHPSARYSDLNTTEMTTDHFNFHIKRLLELGVIEKIDKQYRLSTKGKEFANRLDTDTGLIEKQAKLSTRVCPIRNYQGITQYLLSKRQKQPYYGYLGTPGGKIRWGEEIINSAMRELNEETGLTGTPSLKGVMHKMDYDQTGTLLEDKYFFVVRVDDIQGSMHNRTEECENMWLSMDDILSYEKVFHGLNLTIKMLEGDNYQFIETRYKVTDY